MLGMMLTRDTMADLLKDVNVVEVAKEAEVSTKTIYRLRQKGTSPSLDTCVQIIEAVARIKARNQPAEGAT